MSLRLAVTDAKVREWCIMLLYRANQTVAASHPSHCRPAVTLHFVAGERCGAADSVPRRGAGVTRDVDTSSHCQNTPDLSLGITGHPFGVMMQ